MNYTEKNKLIDQLCGVGLMLIFVEILLAGIHETFTTVFSKNIPLYVYSIGAVLLLIAIIIYICAYKKQSGVKAMYAIELTVIAFMCPFLVYLYMYARAPINQINPKSFWILFLIYYAIKALYIIIKAKGKKIKKHK